MPRSYSRADRIADQILRDLSEIVRLEMRDPRVGMVTFTAAEVTSDCAHARIHFSTLSAPETLPDIEAGLSHAAGFLRAQLGRRLKLHNIPELSFRHDVSLDRGIQLSKLIDAAVATCAVESDENSPKTTEPK